MFILKIHMANPDRPVPVTPFTWDRPLCGAVRKGRVTNNTKEVTCKRCLSKMSAASPEEKAVDWSINPAKLKRTRYIY